MILNSMHNF